jgi:peptide methionine sulfoxide reductase msrA/msrB
MRIILIAIVISLIGLLIFNINNNKRETKPTTFMPSNTNLSNNPESTKTLLVAGGCFWCVESDLEKLPGVVTAVSGYAGGKNENPTYENYSAGGHREVVEVSYDSSVVTFSDIVIYAIKHMDPTDLNGSFHDRGQAYSPALYYEDDAEKEVIEKVISDINDNGPYDKPLAIAVLKRPQFWPAEDYHQDYYKGSLSGLKYQYYRKGSGRDAYIEKYWGTDTGPDLPWQTNKENEINLKHDKATLPWITYQKPASEILKNELEELAYKVTQEEGTERAGSSQLDKKFERGIYVDILSGEPLFSSRDKFDSGTGWPSFTAPISSEAVTADVDK